MTKRGKPTPHPKSTVSGQTRDRKRIDWRRFLPLLVIVGGIAAYANSFPGEFMLDDARNIARNERIHDLWPPWPIINRSRRPVVSLTLAVNYAIGGLSVRGYHAVNLVIHLLAALTLHGIVRRTLLWHGFRGRYEQTSSWLAMVVALAWAVHPLQTESVTYIIQRAESLMGLFYLLTLYCVVRGAHSARGHRWYIVAVAACALGMGSKAVMVSAPLVVFLYDRTFIANSFGECLRRRRALYVGLACTWGVLVACGVARGVLGLSASASAHVGFQFKGITPIEYALTQPGVILHYLRLSIWPHPLCLDYGWPVARTFGAIVPPAIVIIVVLAGTLWALWRRPWLGFVGAWFFLILAPTSSFVPIRDPFFEHRMYLPLAAAVVFVVVGGHTLLERLLLRIAPARALRALITWGVVLAVTAPLGYATVQRNKDYHNEPQMWADVVAKRPDNPRGRYNLGTRLNSAGRYEDAIVQFREALRIDPRHASAHCNLGVALKRSGKVDQAVAEYHKAIRLDPRHANAFSNLGNALLQQGKIDEAIQAYRRALTIKPRHADARLNLGVAFMRQGRY